MFDSNAQEAEGVADDCRLYGFVYWTVCSEGGRVVHFEEPGLELVVNHNVYPEEFKAHRRRLALAVLRSAGVVGMSNRRLNWKESLDEERVDLALQSIHVVSLCEAKGLSKKTLLCNSSAARRAQP